MKLILTLTSLLIFSTHAFSFENTLSDKKVEGITISDQVTLKTFNGLTLKSVASGLRTKKVAFLNFNVYVAELLLPATTTWDQKSMTFENSQSAAVMMTFLREVPAKNISEAFSDGLKKNKVDVSTESIQQFLKKVTSLGDIKKGEVLIIARNQTDAADQLLIQIPPRFSEVVSTKEKWTTSILKIWSGEPADAGITALQKTLFK